MPTQKTRINLTVSEDVERAVQTLAKRDHTTLASKTLELLRSALEIEEDEYLLEVVKGRERTARHGQYLSHKEVWG